MSEDMFAEKVAGVSSRTLLKWRKENTEFRDAVKTARAQYKAREGDLFAQAARARALMILMSGMAVGKDEGDQRKAAQAVLKQVKDVPNAADTISYRAYSDAQLIGEMFGRGFNLPSGELDKFQALVGLEELS